MQELLLWLASLKGVDVEPGAELRLELSAFPSGGLALLVLLGAVAMLVAIVAMYRRDARNLRPLHRRVLAGLRAAAVIIALLLVLEPNIVAVRKEERPGHTILLLDTSQSMASRDAFRRESVRPLAEGWRQLGIEDPTTHTRFELATAALRHQDSALLRQLEKNNKVLVYAFGAGIQPLPLRGPRTGNQFTDAKDELLPDLGTLQPDGRYTNIGGAVRAALERSRESAVAAIVLLSDGRRNLGPQGVEVSRLIAQRKVPHTLVLPIGDPSQTQAVELTRIEAPEKVFQKEPFRLTARLLSQGYDEANVELRLLRGQAEATGGELIDTRRVTVGSGTEETVVEFDQLVAAEPGTFTYRVEVTPPAGEPTVPERHVARTQIEILSEQTRVLLIAGGPSHEYRILQTSLMRDKSVELRCWLSSADANFPQDGNVSIEGLPIDRAEMDEIDVLILLDPNADKLSREFCDLAAEHVLQNGAGLWWVCGEKYTLRALRPDATTAPLAQLIPVVPDLVFAERQWLDFGHAFHRPWPYELTAAGVDDKMVRLWPRREENAEMWRRLPGYHFAFPVVRAKPTATTLVRVTDPRLNRSQEDVPLLARHFVGAGRALFTGTDETYRWRAIYEDQYNKLWVKGIRYLFEGRMNAGNSRLRIDVGEEKVELGEGVKIVARVRDDAYHPLTTDTFELTLQRGGEGAGAETLKLTKVPGVAGEYETTLRPRRTGFYTVAGIGRGEQRVEASFQVVPARVEKQGPVDLAELRGIASAPGGEVLQTPQDLLAAADRVPSLRATDTFRTPHSIWDSWVTVALLLSVLSTEWWLRKRFNLL